jgi:diketogulonate reductase-like aldo/keto reductase
MAAAKGVSPSSVALAWLLAKGPDVVPLVGMGRPENVDRNLETFRVKLSPTDVAALDAAAQEFAGLLRHGAAREGIAASRDKRPPSWEAAMPRLPNFL